MNRRKPGIISHTVFLISLVIFLGMLVYEGARERLRARA